MQHGVWSEVAGLLQAQGAVTSPTPAGGSQSFPVWACERRDDGSLATLWEAGTSYMRFRLQPESGRALIKFGISDKSGKIACRIAMNQYASSKRNREAPRSDRPSDVNVLAETLKMEADVSLSADQRQSVASR